MQCLQRRRQRGLPASAGARRAGDRRHRPRPRRRRHRVDGAGDGREAAPHIVFQIRPAGLRRAADRSEADPRRLGGARRHLDLPGQGREPVPRDLADGRAGAARVKAAARAAGAARRRHPARRAARARTCRRAGSTSACWRCSSTCRSRACDRPSPGCRARARRRRRSPPTRRRARAARRSSITAVNGVPIAGHQGPGSIADETVRKLLMLQGLSRPQRIVSLMSYPGAAGALDEPERRRRDPRQLRRARRRRARAPPQLSASGLTPERVDRADRPAGRDSRPDGRQRALERRDPRRRRTSRGGERGRRKPVATTSPPSPPARRRRRRRARRARPPRVRSRRAPARSGSSPWGRSRSSC